MNVKMFGEICDAFGPSGFEEDVIRTVAKYCKGLELENDAMNNLYARMPGEDPDQEREACTGNYFFQADPFYE